VRLLDDRVGYCGAFYGQSGKGDPYPDGITVQALVGLIDDLPEGFTELGCHPGFAGDLDSVYRCEREIEVRVLCDPAVRQRVEHAGVRLCSFRKVPNA
jgi:chitin disaccharide deacetylase